MTTITDIRPLINTAVTNDNKSNTRKPSHKQVNLSETASLLSEAEELATSASDIDGRPH